MSDPRRRDPMISVIIPHFNDPTRLERCLDALEIQIDDEVECIVVDNGSTCDLRYLKARFPATRFTSEQSPGAGHARNKGAKASRGDRLAFIDADCIPAPDWIAAVKRIASGPSDVVTGGRVTVFAETPGPMSGAEAFETVFAFQMRRYLEQQRFLGSGNLVVARAAFAQVGPFEAKVSEDKEWSQRASRKGMVLRYDPTLIVSHPARQDWPALKRKWKRVTRELFALSQSLGESRRGWACRGVLMPASILLHAPRIATHPDLSWRERWRGLTTLARLRIQRMIWMLRQACGIDV